MWVVDISVYGVTVGPSSLVAPEEQWRIQGGGFLVTRKPPPPTVIFFNQGVTLFTDTVLHQPHTFSTFGNPPETNSGYATEEKWSNLTCFQIENIYIGLRYITLIFLYCL